MIQSNGAIELRWGKGFHAPWARERVRPVATFALQMVRERLNEKGIRSAKNRRVVIDRDPKDIYRGYTKGNTAHVNVSPGRISRANFIDIAGTGLHEVLHTYRDELVPLNSLLAHAASEGLSYVEEYGFCVDLGGRRKAGGHDRSVDIVSRIPTEDIRDIRRRFFRIAAKQESWEDENLFSQAVQEVSPANRKLGMSEVVGIAAVMNHVANGATITDLLPLSSREILGLRAA